MQKNPNDFIIIPKLYIKQIKDLNIIPDTVKFTEERVGNNPEDIGTRKDFLNGTQLAHPLRVTIKKCDLMKLGNFCKEKKYLICQLIECKKKKTNYILQKVQCTITYKELDINVKVGYRYKQNP